MEDTYRHKGLRRLLIGLLKEKGIFDENVLNAMSMLPRHYFLDKAFEEWAYSDVAFPIGKEQTISQPYTVAYQTALLAIKKGDKVLEIGTGSGYQAAVLALMDAEVYSVERHELLYKNATQLLKDLQITNVKTFLSDGNDGLTRHAPFDKILFTAGAEKIPTTLLHQLKVGGIMVIPIGDEKGQVMHKITKIGENDFKEQRFDTFQFVPFLKGVNRES